MGRLAPQCVWGDLRPSLAVNGMKERVVMSRIIGIVHVRGDHLLVERIATLEKLKK